MQATVPYEESTMLIYELLFCDRPELYNRNSEAKSSYPWNILSAHEPSVKELQAITEDETLESRVQLLAWHRLREMAADIETKKLVGVVIEVGLEGGLDTLAAYKDGCARYLNHSGKMIMWNAKTEQSSALIEQLFTASEEVVRQIGPWDKARLAPPTEGMIRLNFLVSDGLYFGQGPFDVLQKDAMAGGVIYAATQLMMFLTEQK
jgi:hypothetical protein